VPWNDVTRNQSDYIDDQYLPIGFQLQKEPSKMNKTEIETLLLFWYKREQSSRVPVAFQFKAYKDRSNGHVVDVVDKIKTNGRSKRTKGGKRNVKRLQGGQSSSREEARTEVTPTGSQGQVQIEADDETPLANALRSDIDAASRSEEGLNGAKGLELDEARKGPSNSNGPVGGENFPVDEPRGGLNNSAAEGGKDIAEADGKTRTRKRKGPPGIRVTETDMRIVRTRSESGQVHVPIQTRAAAQRQAKQKSKV